MRTKMRLVYLIAAMCALIGIIVPMAMDVEAAVPLKGHVGQTFTGVDGKKEVITEVRNNGAFVTETLGKKYKVSSGCRHTREKQIKLKLIKRVKKSDKHVCYVNYYIGTYKCRSCGAITNRAIYIPVNHYYKSNQCVYCNRAKPKK